MTHIPDSTDAIAAAIAGTCRACKRERDCACSICSAPNFDVRWRWPARCVYYCRVCHYAYHAFAHWPRREDRIYIDEDGSIRGYNNIANPNPTMIITM